jgi:hypothetical protein
MNNPPGQDAGGAGHEDTMAALFVSLVMQNTNMALIFLGHAPNPQTGQTGQDLEYARHFIDQLEMLAVKTKGNLDKQEESLLKQSLTSLRLAFVEAVEHPRPVEPSGTPAAAPETPPAQPAAPSPGAGESESHKKFSKKY